MVFGPTSTGPLLQPLNGPQELVCVHLPGKHLRETVPLAPHAVGTVGLFPSLDRFHLVFSRGFRWGQTPVTNTVTRTGSDGRLRRPATVRRVSQSAQPFLALVSTQPGPLRRYDVIGR